MFDFPLTTVYNEHIFEFYGGNMLGHIYEETTKYMKIAGKDVRKKKGQFFTPVNIAAYMGKWTMAKEHLDILDAGAGSGILTAGIIEHLLTIDGCRSIKVTFVENDPIILPLLKKNADYIQNICENHNIIFRYTIWSDSFFAINISQKYDIVISNPPYKKIAKNSEEASLMKDYVYGQPNLYGLFMAKGLEWSVYLYYATFLGIRTLLYRSTEGYFKNRYRKNPYFLRPRYCFFRRTSLAGNNDPFWKKGKRANREN